ncbi:MAG: peroxiredoxin [Rhodospirillaceae bacterium]
MEGRRLPDVVFKTRVRDESIPGPNPYRWQDRTTADFFSGKRAAVFSLPGAYTPTCSSKQCPGYEAAYDEIRRLKVDEVYCISVNDAFVMYQWAKMLNIKHVKMIPDGSGHFTRRMGMLVNKEHLGFGYRSWRYAMIVQGGVIEKWFEEPGINDEGADQDPYETTDPENIITYLTAVWPRLGAQAPGVEGAHRR